MEILQELIKKITISTSIVNCVNIKKSKLLELKDYSMKTQILYFLENDLKNIPRGYSNFPEAAISKKTVYFEKRSLLEYLPMQRHPIIYYILKCDDKYFLRCIQNKQNINNPKLEIIKTHIIGSNKIITNDKFDLIETIRVEMLSDAFEKFNLSFKDILKIDFNGFIKDIDVQNLENSHLGMIYILDINPNMLQKIKKCRIVGDWFDSFDIKHKANIKLLDNYTEIIFNKLLK